MTTVGVAGRADLGNDAGMTTSIARLVGLLASFLFLAAACSAGSSSNSTETDDASDDTSESDSGDASDTASTEDEPDVDADTGSGGESADSDDDLVRIGLVAEPASLDFTTTDGAAIPQLLLKNVYEGLVTIDVESGEIVGALAESWEVDDTNTVYTFDLVEDATFSNGGVFTADDAKFSLDQVNSDAWTVSLKSQLAVIESTEAKDDTTLVVTLSQPSNSFLYALTTRVGAMFDTDGVADLANTPIGTGPYLFDGWDRGSKITLVANPDYRGDAPHFSTVEMMYFTDANALNNAMLTDAIDVVSTVQAPESLGEFETGDYQIIEGTTNGEVVLSMNQADGAPLSDLRLRQAVRHAIDHQALMDICWAGRGELIGSMAPPTDPWYVDHTDDYPFSVDDAKALIADAGAEGTELRLRLPTLPYAVACGTVVESMLEDVGFEVTVDELEFPAAWLETVFTNKDFDMSIVAHVEPRDMANVFGSADYYITYGTDEIQTIFAGADSGSAEDQVDRLKEAAALISEDAAADFLFLLPNLMVAAPDITGLPENAITESFDLSRLARS